LQQIAARPQYAGRFATTSVDITRPSDGTDELSDETDRLDVGVKCAIDFFRPSVRNAVIAPGAFRGEWRIGNGYRSRRRGDYLLVLQKARLLSQAMRSTHLSTSAIRK
jgi:hypothetical protein